MSQFESRSNVFMSAMDGKIYKQPQARNFEWRAAAVGMLHPNDISAIEAKVVLNEVIGLARPDYNLTKMCRTVRMDKLVAEIPTATKMTGHEKVPPLKEAEISAMDYDTVDFKLWKNVVHVVASDEAVKMAALDVMAINIEDAAAEIARMKNSQIAAVAEANITEKVSGVPYSDWGARTSGVNDTDPMLAINASMDYILEQGHKPDFIAMPPTIWGKFITNTWIRDLVHSGIFKVAQSGGRINLPGYPSVEIITDFSLTTTPTSAIGPIVGSKRGMMLGEGPVEAAKYRKETASYGAYIIRDYMEPKVVDDSALDMIAT